MEERELSKKQANNIRRLAGFRIDPSIEEETRILYQLACNGSKEVLEKYKHIDFEDYSEEMRQEFILAVHSGMYEAQSIITKAILGKEEISDSRDLIFTGIADAIAWQLIHLELAHARRLFKEQKKVDTKNSNFSSVVTACEHIKSQDKFSIPLISDLTSFVQVGDLLIKSLQGTTISEVKEGKVNKEFIDFLSFYDEFRCEKSMELFKSQLDTKKLQQFNRFLRQKDRMKHAAKIIMTGNDVDPDTGKKIVIPDDPVFVDRWITEFSEDLKNKEDKSYKVRVIDNCLYIGYYFNQDSVSFGPGAFWAWLESSEATEDSPCTSMIHAMTHPLALPIFNFFINEEDKYNLLFSRKHACVGLNIPAFLNECSKNGISYRFGNNKETSKLEQAGLNPFKFQKKSIYLSMVDKEFALSDGLFVRIFFHFQNPISTVKAILESLLAREGYSKD